MCFSETASSDSNLMVVSVILLVSLVENRNLVIIVIPSTPIEADCLVHYVGRDEASILYIIFNNVAIIIIPDTSYVQEDDLPGL